MRNLLLLVLAGSVAAFAFFGPATVVPVAEPGLVAPEEAPPAPDFVHRLPAAWLNSEPLSLTDLRGQVVLIDFWAFECRNCYRSFPWLKALESNYASKGLQVVGVHTPEFEREKVRANVVDKAAEYGLHHPIMIDNDMSYWRAMRNRYWPAYYLLDKQGRVRAIFVGETRVGDRQSKAIETAIQQLLTEPSEPVTRVRSQESY